MTVYGTYSLPYTPCKHLEHDMKYFLQEKAVLIPESQITLYDVSQSETRAKRLRYQKYCTTIVTLDILSREKTV